MRVRKLLAASIAIFAAIAVAQPAAADAIRDREYWLADYGFTKAWKITKGAGIKVAVIDTGIDASHPDLQESVSMGIDVSGLGSEDGLSPIGENFFHGTLVASLLAGRGHDGHALSRDDEGARINGILGRLADGNRLAGKHGLVSGQLVCAE